MIEHTNYKPEKKSQLRKQALKKAILKTNFDSIYLSLQDLQEKLTGYKTDRIENDLRWMKKECKKGRFNSQEIKTENRENYGSKYHDKKAELETRS